tara:strand:- start:2800 stop:3459 length:660 start_codon:yes stop_codon:yes gene_type:complete
MRDLGNKKWGKYPSHFGRFAQQMNAGGGGFGGGSVVQEQHEHQYDNANPFSLVNSTNKTDKNNNKSISVSRSLREWKREKERDVIKSNEIIRDPIDAREIFSHIKDINDPEHPYSLEQLAVVSEENVKVEDELSRVTVFFTPTVEHCSMATLIGLSIRVKLMRVLPKRFKVDVKVSKGSHASEAQVNKQLQDKERVAAALENGNLLEKVELTLSGKTAM